MTPRESARYRLELADRALKVARESLDRSEWREAALFARAAVEHAAKAVMACFAAVSRTHDPQAALGPALANPAFPAALRDRAEELSPRLATLGPRLRFAEPLTNVRVAPAG